MVSHRVSSSSLGSLSSVLHLPRPQFQSCTPWGVHPACILEVPAVPGPRRSLQACEGSVPAILRAGHLWGPSPNPFPCAPGSAPQRPLRRQGPPGSGAPRARGGERGGARQYLGRPGAGGGLSGDSRRPLQIRIASRRGTQGSGRRGCVVTWAAATGPHLSGRGTAPASSASLGLAPAGRPALCPPGAPRRAAPRRPCRAMRARAPPR